MLRRLLTTVAALLLVLDAGCLPFDNSVEDNDDHLLPISVKPLAYNLSLMLNANQTRFNGTVEIRVSALTTTDTITLHCEGLEITNSTLFRISEERKIQIVTNPVRYDTELQRCAFTMPGRLAQLTNFLLVLEFNGSYNNGFGISKDFYTTADGTKKWITQTEFQPSYARRVFPCFDEPAYKARFTLRVGRPQNMTTISNMPLKSSTVDMDTSIVWDEFEETPLMSTFHLAFIVSDFVNVTDPHTNVSVWLPEKWTKYAGMPLRITSKVITFLQEYTGIAYPLPKLDHVAVPNPGHDAMSNWGIITYRDYYFVCEEEMCATHDTELITGLLIHGTTNQWFGNLVTLNRWSHVWLIEGFATYFESYITSVLIPSWRPMEFFCVGAMQSALHLDVKSTTHPLTSFSVGTREEYSSMFSLISYLKGASIVYMLRNILSEESFRRGISDYLKKHAYENVIEDNLWESLSKTVGNSSVDFAEIMHCWTHETGFPLVTVQRENNSIILTQEKYLGKRSEAGVRWWIPLTYTTSSDVNFNNSKVKEWFTPNANTLVLDLPVYNNEWIILNIGFAGYYRVNYDMLTWKLLTKYLRQCNANEVPPVSKSQILDDAFTLAVSGHVDYKTVLDMASFLQCEMDHIPWFAAVRVFSTLMNKLYITEAYSLFKSYMLELAAETYNKYSFEKMKSIDEKSTQNIIVSWVCELGYDHCQSTAVELINQMMSGVNDSIPIDLLETAMCTAVKVGNEKVWSYLHKLYNETNDTLYRAHIINSMGCTLHRGNVHRLLTDIFDNADYIREDDVGYILDAIASKQHNVPVLIDFFLQNFTGVYETLQDGMLETLQALAEVQTTAEDSEKLKKIVSLLPVNKTSAEVITILDNIRANEEWMSRHYDTLFEWLKDHQYSTDAPSLPSEELIQKSKEFDPDNVTTTDSLLENGLHLDSIPEITTHLPRATTFKPNSTTTVVVYSLSLLLASQIIVIFAY